MSQQLVSFNFVNVKFSFGKPANVGAKLRSTQTRTYITDFLVISDDVLALIRIPENAIELCRIDTTNSTASLQTICFLELPPLMPYARLTSASIETENNHSKSTTHPRRRPHRPPPRYSFSPSPTESLVLLTLTAKITTSALMDMPRRTYTLAMHARTLLSYASPSSQASRLSHPLVVPWGTWGLLATRCFEGPSRSSPSMVVVAGQRWLDIKCGVIRDFCPHHVRRARRAAGTTNHLVGLRSSTLAAGRVFECDIESALPYCEIPLEKDASDSSFVAEDAMIDLERVVLLTTVSGLNRHLFLLHAMMT